MSSPLLLALVLHTVVQCINCGIPLSPGETKPTRIEIKINSNANITCQLNLSTFGGKRNSTSLYFVEEDTGKQVPRDDIVILNETTIVFMLRNAKAQDRNYICKSGLMGIGVTHVSVGTAPLNVTDFKCRGYDYTYMVCNFTIPDNVLLTQYNLSYTAQSPNYLQVCQLEIQNNQGICNLTLDKNNYRQNYEFYNFTLTGHNEVGTNPQSFWINHYESVIPPRPEYRFEQVTTNSVVLTWHMPKYSYYTTKGLQYEIRLRPRGEGFDWINHSNYEIYNNRSEYKLKLRNLPYAHYWYKVSVRIRVRKSARNDETTWSEPFVREFQTSSCPPDSPPKTDVGSFYVDPTETRVHLYWRQLPVYEENGPNFEYVVTRVKRDGVDLSLEPVRIDRTSAVFPWHKRHSYEFWIKSRNAEGDSAESSYIAVPAWTKHYERREPSWIRNIYHATNRTYTLSWSAPAQRSDLVDYTVFWCQSKRAIPNECKDSINFEHVDRNMTRFITTPQEQDRVLNLAVSANFRDFNSGMHWTMCTADVSSDLVRLEPELTPTTSRSISVQWSSDRVCSSLLEGYNLTYCRVESALATDESIVASDQLECLDQPITLTIEKTAKKYTIEKLQPFSAYKIEMYMFSKLKKGKVSDAQVVVTKEDAPSPPRSLKYYNITTNSAMISWLPPAELNGILRSYTIVHNNEHQVVNCKPSAADRRSVCNGREISFKLENLSSFTNYKVYVVAYTIEASPPSNDIHFKTLIGIPSNPRHMVPAQNNRTVMQWSKPEVPSGRVEFYEVGVIVWYKERIQRQRISGVVGSTECVINIPLCIDTDYRHTLQVRAVNVAERKTEIDHQMLVANLTEDDADASFYTSNEDLKCVGTFLSEADQLSLLARYRNKQKYVHYKSVWEKGPIYGCAAPTKLSRITLLALLVVVSSVGVMAAFYVARNKYNKMADIACTLPPGLEAIPYPTKDNGADGDFRHSKESLYNNENRRLLSSISNDSGYLCNGGGGGVDGITGCSVGKSSGYIGSDNSVNYCQQETFVVDTEQSSENSIIEQTPVVDDAYMVMELLKPTADKAPAFEALITQPDSNGYVQPSLTAIAAMNAAKTISPPPPPPMTPESQIPIIPSDNGYIKPSNIFNWKPQKQAPPTNQVNMMDLPIGSNGYVAPQLLQKAPIQPSYDGYTSLEALGKSLMREPTIHSATANTFLNAGGGGLPPISGYVTQKELSAFGQQQHLT